MVVFDDLALKIGRVPNVEFKVVPLISFHPCIIPICGYCVQFIYSYHNAADKKNNFRVSMAFSIKLDNFD